MHNKGMSWLGNKDHLCTDSTAMIACLSQLERACFVVQTKEGVALATTGETCIGDVGLPLLAALPPMPPSRLGDPAFLSTYNLRYAYMAGSMANAISSVDMVVALGKAGMLGAFGAGGLMPPQLETAIHAVQAALPEEPYAFNILNSPHEPVLEKLTVGLYLKHGVHVVEASAYLRLTPELIRYRVTGLSRNADGSVHIGNRVIAKISRSLVAKQFLSPASKRIVADLLEANQITLEQAELAALVPMADDITVEADSGGHTDNRPLSVLLPLIIKLRDKLQAKYQYPVPVRIGAAGGIGAPGAVLGAFMMGAAYVMTGSINQGCVEAGTSERVKAMLAKAASTDVIMAPAADMFEMGVKVQVLKRGTMFGLRAKKLYDLYSRYDSIEMLPAEERDKLEQDILKRPLDAVWQECVAFFQPRDASQIVKAEQDPKHKMALIFRWYLGLAMNWAVIGDPERVSDYEIPCGPAMGGFNDWTRGTWLARTENRYVVDVAVQLMTQAVALFRLQQLKTLGIHLPVSEGAFLPKQKGENNA